MTLGAADSAGKSCSLALPFTGNRTRVNPRRPSTVRPNSPDEIQSPADSARPGSRYSPRPGVSAFPRLSRRQSAGHRRPGDSPDGSRHGEGGVESVIRGGTSSEDIRVGARFGRNDFRHGPSRRGRSEIKCTGNPGPMDLAHHDAPELIGSYRSDRHARPPGDYNHPWSSGALSRTKDEGLP